jgi:hypothetical protein
MGAIALRLEHSVKADVTQEFAWKYRTNVETWNDPPARFALDGPFVADARGTTLLPGQPSLHWSIRDVQAPNVFILEMPLDGAVLSFEWRFEALSERRTKVTQTIVLSGDHAQTHVGQVDAAFRPGLADGMERIAAEMSAAAGRSTCR